MKHEQYMRFLEEKFRKNLADISAIQKEMEEKRKKWQEERAKERKQRAIEREKERKKREKALAIEQKQRAIEQTEQEKRKKEWDNHRREWNKGMQELRVIQKETAQMLKDSKKENDQMLKDSKKANDQMLKDSKKANDQMLKDSRKETDYLLKESKKETDYLMKDLLRDNKRLKHLFTNRWGELVESLVSGCLVRLLKERNIQVTGLFPNLEATFIGEPDKRCEVDIIARNGKEVVATEVKSTLKVKDVNRFLTILQKFDSFFPEYKDKKVYGAMAFLKSYQKSDVYAMKKGLFAIRATGDSACIINDKNFKPVDFSK